MNRLICHVRALYPSELRNLSDEGLADRIHRAIDRATGYGLRTEYDIARFVEFQAYLGQDFDVEVPWAAEILRTEGVPGTQRMNRLDKAAQQHLPAIGETDRDR